MSSVKPLEPTRLYHHCDPRSLRFTTTAELEPLTEIIGQERATRALHFGIGMTRSGYNLYVMGPPGMGRHAMVRHYLEERSTDRPPPDDWCYLNNFEQPHKPIALRLPPGMGRKLRDDMAQLVEELAGALPAAFEGDEYRNRIQALEDELKEQQEHAFNDLSEEAGKHNVRLFRTPSGFTFAPLKDGEVIGPEEFEKLPEKEQNRIEEVVANLQERLKAIIQQFPQLRRETREKVKALNRETAKAVVDHYLDEMKADYHRFEQVQHYLARVEEDLIENVKDFLKTEEGGEGIPGQHNVDPKQLHRYQVNLLIDNTDRRGAPIVHADHPTYLNLIGRAEHLAQYGTLITDFTLLKPGALHAANGGYLILDAHKLLTQPYAWDALKRSLYANEIHIESLERRLSLISTVALEPEPIPLDIKVVIIGDRLLYYLLYEYDPDFAELFKVSADFDNRIDRNEVNQQSYAQLVATVAHKEQLRPFERDAVARIIEHGSRLVEDAEKLSTHMRAVTDLMREADHWAGINGSEVIRRQEVQEAIDQQIYRTSRVRERIQEEIARGTLLINTEGARVGQINGLSVLSMGESSFGQPSRITATVHLGEGSVVDIEREVELGGALHSKGVMILSSFLAARYAQRQPLSLAASLVFEQSYAMVDGDSASLAELCALLSALSGLPIRQSLAVTGSIDQHGLVQPIGGVNEKIEGFFDVCRVRGLNGEQGVVIPVANIKHLMLREDVVAAAEGERFHIYPVSSVDAALEMLTGLKAGAPDADGNYPEETVNGKVQAALRTMSERRQAFAETAKPKDDGHEGEIDV